MEKEKPSSLADIFDPRMSEGPEKSLREFTISKDPEHLFNAIRKTGYVLADPLVQDQIFHWQLACSFSKDRKLADKAGEYLLRIGRALRPPAQRGKKKGILRQKKPELIILYYRVYQLCRSDAKKARNECKKYRTTDPFKERLQKIYAHHLSAAGEQPDDSFFDKLVKEDTTPSEIALAFLKNFIAAILGEPVEAGTLRNHLTEAKKLLKQRGITE